MVSHPVPHSSKHHVQSPIAEAWSHGREVAEPRLQPPVILLTVVVAPSRSLETNEPADTPRRASKVHLQIAYHRRARWNATRSGGRKTTSGRGLLPGRTFVMRRRNGKGAWFNNRGQSFQLPASPIPTT